MQYRIARGDLGRHEFGSAGSFATLFHGGQHGLSTISLMLGEVQPGEGAALHRHPYEELFVLHEGQARYTIAGVTVEAGVGDVVLIPAHTPHSFANTGAGVLRQTAVHAADKVTIEWLDG